MPGTPVKPWSHRSPIGDGRLLDPGELEALSRRYSSATILLLPLADGRTAVFDNSRALRDIRDEAPTHSELRKWSELWEAELRATALHAERLAGMGLGEPDARAQARDLRRRAQVTSSTPLDPIEIDLSELL